MLAGDINLDPGPAKMMYNNNMQYSLPFCNTNLSIDLTEYQFNIDSDNSNSGDKQSMFKTWAIHFIHLNLNSLLLKIEGVHHLVKLTNVSVTRYL